MKRRKEYSASRPYLPVGLFLRKMRDRSGLTQREVALSLEYSSAQFISNFERGMVLPPLKKLKILVKLYSMDVHHLMDLVLESGQNKMKAELLNKRHY